MTGRRGQMLQEQFQEYNLKQYSIMKKIILAAMAFAALAACTKETTVDVAREEIAFGNAFVDNSTKAETATDPSYSTTGTKGVPLEQFNVYGAVNGVNIFDGDNVTKDDAGYGEAWAHDGAKQYWIAGAPYKFVGVVDGNKTVAETVVTNTNLDAAGLPINIEYTVDGETDLLCDVVNIASASASQGIVAFSYTHLLSKINFAVKNTTDASATNYRFVLTSAKLTNVYKNAVYGVDADAWTTTGSEMREYVLENLTINSNATQYHSQEVLLIPGSSVGVSIAAEIQATDDGTTWKKVSEVTKTFSDVVTLAKATAYNFIVELGVGTEIQFTATTMDEWTDGDGTGTVLQ